MKDFYKFIHSWEGFIVFIIGLAIVYFGTSYLYNWFVFTDNFKKKPKRYHEKLESVKSELHTISSILNSIKCLKINIDEMSAYHDEIKSLYRMYNRAFNNLIMIIQYANVYGITDDEKTKLSRISKKFLNVASILLSPNLCVRYFGRHSEYVKNNKDSNIRIKEESQNKTISEVIYNVFKELSKMNKIEESCARVYLRYINDELSIFIEKYKIDNLFSDIKENTSYSHEMIVHNYKELESIYKESIEKSNVLSNIKNTIELLENGGDNISYEVIKKVYESSEYVDMTNEIIDSIINRYIDMIYDNDIDIYITAHIPTIFNINNNAYDEKLPREDLGSFNFDTVRINIPSEIMHKIKDLEAKYMDYIKSVIIE